MRASRFVTLSWIVAAAFFLGTVLFAVDRLNLVAQPPQFPDTTNLVDRILGSFDYRLAIWPVFLATNLLFALGFAALVPFAAAMPRSAQGAARPIGPTLLALGAVIGAISSLVTVGSVDPSISTPYCDCGFKEQEVISQAWALMIAGGVANWLLLAASIGAGIAILVLRSELGAGLPWGLQALALVTAALLIATPVLARLGLLDPLPDLLTALTAGILVPIWAIWIGSALGGGAGQAAAQPS